MRASLLPLIDFQLDPATMKAGGFGAPISFYPVARALAEIGGVDVLRGVFQRLATRADDRTLRACTWVLAEMLDRDIALAAVEQKAAAEEKRLGPQLWAESVHKANLERAKALLEQPTEILLEAPKAAAPPATK